MSLYAHAQTIIQETIRQVQPGPIVHAALKERAFGSGRLILVAVGKSAWQMASAASECLGERMDAGIVITKDGHLKGPLNRIACFEAGHPVPDERSIQATDTALELTKNLTHGDNVLFLLSGGGSALFEKPLVSLAELQDITRQLLRSGAGITQMNTIRKRLSAVKGGRFAKHCAPANVHAIIISDVIGNRPDMIASGPTCPDPSTSAEALGIVDRYQLKLSEQARDLIRQETPKSLPNSSFRIGGGVETLCAAALQSCQRLGYNTILLTTSLTCEAAQAGAFLGAIAREHHNSVQPMAWIAGGETVVRITGNGKGGRNQEIALAAANEISGLDRVAVFSIGSDGTDGPTDAAGGYVDGNTPEAIQKAGMDVWQALRNNDSYHALKAAGGLLITGPTGTNVNDVSIILIGQGDARP